MIFGNPDKFALYVDVVQEWSMDNELNGISGVYINGHSIMSNYGLISLNNEFYNLFSKSENIKEGIDLFNLDNLSILKILIKNRFPNWWAYSQEDWLSKENQWVDIKECKSFDFSLESFSIGCYDSKYLFFVKQNSLVRIFLYILKDSNFFDFSKITIDDIFVVDVSYNNLLSIIKKMENYLLKINQK